MKFGFDSERLLDAAPILADSGLSLPENPFLLAAGAYLGLTIFRGLMFSAVRSFFPLLLIGGVLLYADPTLSEAIATHFSGDKFRSLEAGNKAMFNPHLLYLGAALLMLHWLRLVRPATLLIFGVAGYFALENPAALDGIVEGGAGQAGTAAVVILGLLLLRTLFGSAGFMTAIARGRPLQWYQNSGLPYLRMPAFFGITRSISMTFGYLLLLLSFGSLMLLYFAPEAPAVALPFWKPSYAPYLFPVALITFLFSIMHLESSRARSM